MTNPAYEDQCEYIIFWNNWMNFGAPVYLFAYTEWDSLQKEFWAFLDSWKMPLYKGQL